MCLVSLERVYSVSSELKTNDKKKIITFPHFASQYLTERVFTNDEHWAFSQTVVAYIL